MRIGIVNDTPTVVEALRRAIALRPEHQVIWTAYNGAEGVELCARQTPDLILMDLIMPQMDGVEATRRIMAATPCAILIVTVSVNANTWRAFEAMGHGALDTVDAPELGLAGIREGSGPLLAKIDTIGRLIGDKPQSAGALLRAGASPPPRGEGRLLALGASAGGPAALAKLLSGLPEDFPAATVIIQHVDQQFSANMAKWLGRQSKMPVRLAVEGDRPEPGLVLLAGSNDHLVLKTPDRLGYTSEPVDYAYRPSVDAFFQSVGRLWQGEAVGVLLTGMGRDGALGLKALRNKGCYTIAQDQASSVVYGMPKAAAAIDAAVETLSLEHIAPRLVTLFARSPQRLMGELK